MSELESLHVPNVGPLVIVQLALFIAIVGTAIVTWMRGDKKKGNNQPESSGGVSLFFDGPLNAALNTLQGIYRVLDEIKDDNRRFHDKMDERHERETEILRDIRDRRTRR